MSGASSFPASDESSSYRRGRRIPYPGSCSAARRLRSVSSMRSRLLSSTVILLAVTAALTGCAVFDPGTRVSEDRPITDINEVVLDTSGDLTMRVGSTPSLRITAGENVIGELTSEISDGVLTLGMEKTPIGWNGEIRYSLTVTTLETLHVRGSGDAQVDFTGATAPSIDVQGSGDVEAAGVAADSASVVADGSGSISVDDVQLSELTVRMTGSGGVEIDGTAAAQDVEVAGSGGFSAASLRSDRARVVVTGSGDADVDARLSLDVVIDGSGDVSYAGDPSVTKKISGSGELHRR
ncbi:hypothetical protein CQ047_18550 [Microbacterium sp. MYb72]|nr:hypothetical protein CQ047_18550 [Microbacterium sp. MYb72]